MQQRSEFDVKACDFDLDMHQRRRDEDATKGGGMSPGAPPYAGNDARILCSRSACGAHYMRQVEREHRLYQCAVCDLDCDGWWHFDSS